MSATVGAIDRDADRGRRVRQAAVGVVAALLLVALGKWGRSNPQDLIWVDRLFDHVYVFGVVAALLGAWGVSRLTRRRGWQVVLLVSGGLIAASWAVVGLFFNAWDGTGEVQAAEDSPGGPYRAIVRLSYANIPDPVWIVSVQRAGGLTAREFVVGCINGDDPSHTFERIEWIDREHFAVKASRYSATVRVDHASGKPSPVGGKLWNC